jgi:hypothetical protein
MAEERHGHGMLCVNRPLRAFMAGYGQASKKKITVRSVKFCKSSETFTVIEFIIVLPRVYNCTSQSIRIFERIWKLVGIVPNMRLESLRATF